MSENKHTPDIKCYRINYNSKYWANVAAKVGNQCSSPVGAVFAVNALCDAYEDIAKQRDELLAALGSGGRHCNDDTPHSDLCEAIIDSKEADLGQGLDPFWKWAFRRGFHEAETSYKVDIATLEQQRDELLAELQRFMDSHEECTDFDGFTAQIVSMADYHQAQEAIARAKGEH